MLIEKEVIFKLHCGDPEQTTFTIKDNPDYPTGDCILEIKDHDNVSEIFINDKVLPALADIILGYYSYKYKIEGEYNADKSSS